MLKTPAMGLAFGTIGAILGYLLFESWAAARGERWLPWWLFGLLVLPRALPTATLVAFLLTAPLRLLWGNFPSRKVFFTLAASLGLALGPVILTSSVTLWDSISMGSIQVNLGTSWDGLLAALVGGAFMGLGAGHAVEQEILLREGAERLRTHFARRPGELL